MSAATVKPAAGPAPTVAHRLDPPSARGVARRVLDACTAAPATMALVAALVVVWIAERLLFGVVHDHRPIGSLAFGALPNADIPGRGSPGELWRFVSSGLVHDRTSPLHLTVNCVALIAIGSVIERFYGRLVMVAVVVLGVVAGGVAWMTASAFDLVAEPDYTIGLSAGISALVGMMLVYGYRHRKSLGDAQAYSMKLKATLGVSILLLCGLTIPNLNNIAHGAGFVCGVLLAMALPAVPAAGGRRLDIVARVSLVAVLALAALCVVMAAANLVLRLTV